VDGNNEKSSQLPTVALVPSRQSRQSLLESRAPPERDDAHRADQTRPEAERADHTRLHRPKARERAKTAHASPVQLPSLHQSRCVARCLLFAHPLHATQTPSLSLSPLLHLPSPRNSTTPFIHDKSPHHPSPIAKQSSAIPDRRAAL
jgi:hypothetical protein